MRGCAKQHSPSGKQIIIQFDYSESFPMIGALTGAAVFARRYAATDEVLVDARCISGAAGGNRGISAASHAALVERHRNGIAIVPDGTKKQPGRFLPGCSIRLGRRAAPVLPPAAQTIYAAALALGQ